MPENTLIALLEEQVAAHPERIALTYGEERMSYAGLAALSRRLAAGLRAQGIGEGDRVALWLPNTPAYVALLFACWRLGAVATAVNTRFRSVEVGDIVGRSGAKALVYWPDFKQIPFTEILGEVPAEQLAALETVIVYTESGANIEPPLPDKRTVSFGDLAAHDELAEDFSDPDIGCAIFTTSGTTKAPKFVLHRQFAPYRHNHDVADAYGLREHDDLTLLQAIPLCGVFGFNLALSTLAAGGRLVLMPVFDGAEAVKLMRAERVTYTGGSDDLWNALLKHAEGTPAFPDLKLGICALLGSSDETIWQRAEDRGVKLSGTYGMSEIQALFSIWPIDAPLAERARAGGVPVSSEARIRCRHPDSGELCADGEPGEIEVRAPSMLLEYFRNPEATAEAFTEDGFFRTGDLGVTLGEGEAFEFHARMGDTMRLGGFLVAPAEIEAHLQAHPSVAEVQVVAAKTPQGPRAVAFVIAAEGARPDEADLQAHCEGQLAKFKIPARIFVVEEFPMTPGPNGFKVQKAKLRNMAEERIGG
jgi:fatty-acyl-CoA synthase